MIFCNVYLSIFVWFHEIRFYECFDSCFIILNLIFVVISGNSNNCQLNSVADILECDVTSVNDHVTPPRPCEEYSSVVADSTVDRDYWLIGGGQSLQIYSFDY